MRSEFSISHKRRLSDSVCINGEYHRVSSLIEKNPMLLWNAIHKNRLKNLDSELGIIKDFKTISLVRTVYAMLKQAVAKIAPNEVATVEAQFEYNKKLRQHAKQINMLKHEINCCKIGIKGSRFKRLS